MNEIPQAGQLRPADICRRLDEFVIGQGRAKRALAIALRNRWRRLMLSQETAAEITPKNILMIGPTGVGKTELARRLAALAGAPFLKVDATRFTEVGYVGRDVESIVRDLVEQAYKMEKNRRTRIIQEEARQKAEESLLDLLQQQTQDTSRDELRRQLQNDELEDREIQAEFQVRPTSVGVVGPPGLEEMTRQIQTMVSQMGSLGKEGKTCRVSQARKRLIDEKSEQMLDDEQISAAAVEAAEQSGVVFIDEIDKVCGNEQGAEVSRRGVQRDLLPLIEGCQVNTRLGTVRTDHVLFIASGAFHLSKPSDLIPELQGRLPIRVQLESLTRDDMARILTQPKHSLFKQYQALLSVEGVSLTLTPDAAQLIADIAVNINASTEDIGARRLHTMLEHLLEEILFDPSAVAPSGDSSKADAIEIDIRLVQEKLGSLAGDSEQSRYVL